MSANAFLVEGPHAVGEALRAGDHEVRELFVTPAAAGREAALIRSAEAAGGRVTVVTDRVADTLADTRQPQGVAAVVTLPAVRLDDVLSRSPGLVVVLVGAGDPGNVGTVIRTADAAGAAAVVLTDGSSDPYAGKSVRASAGSVFHLPVVTGMKAEAAVVAVRGAGLTVLATTSDGESDLYAMDGVLATPTAWLFGSEAHGLSVDVRAVADRRVRIPIHGQAESLNLAAAAAVCLYASARAQRR